MQLDSNKEWAFLGSDSNSLLIGEGPFQRHARCPTETTAFYQNSFDLSNPRPWHAPTKVHELHRDDLKNFFPAVSPPDIEWQEPDVAQFSQVFSEIIDAIEQGELQKSVPVAVESASLDKTSFPSFAGKLTSIHPNLNPYGFWDGNYGFIGASPEFLFRSFEGKLSTMALAGTATRSERTVFTVDQKEIQEHEFVANTLQESLAPLGMTRRHQRSILNLGELIHFHTAIDVALYHSHHPDDLIKHLHPTPALGALPRNSNTMKQLFSWRNQLDCPSYFGAPFGVYHKGKLDLLVGIRMLGYENGSLLLPSGCGIINASRLTNEWRELKLKRDSVKQFFEI